LKTKISALRECWEAGNKAEALKIAARFPRLPPEHKTAIQRGMEALQRPEFQRQLGRDPAALLEAGYKAVQAAYIQAPEGLAA